MIHLQCNAVTCSFSAVFSVFASCAVLIFMHVLCAFCWLEFCLSLNSLVYSWLVYIHVCVKLIVRLHGDCVWLYNKTTAASESVDTYMSTLSKRL